MKTAIKERFAGKVMIITGAARGIGEAAALRAAEEGASLVLVDKRETEGLEVLKKVQALGADTIWLTLDLSLEESAKTMVAETLKRFGKLDIAVNNAGVMGNPNPLHLVPKEDMDFTFANNFYTVYFCCKHEIEYFLTVGGGVIVNNASIAGVTGLPGNPAYNASKHAVNGLTKNMAIDYAKKGIRINSVNPSGTKTPMVAEAYQYVMEKINEAIAAGMNPEDAMSMAGQKQKNVFERELEADEQAAVILFLCSDDASCMTAATVQTDGGWTSF